LFLLHFPPHCAMATLKMLTSGCASQRVISVTESRTTESGLQSLEAPPKEGRQKVVDTALLRSGLYVLAFCGGVLCIPHRMHAAIFACRPDESWCFRCSASPPSSVRPSQVDASAPNAGIYHSKTLAAIMVRTHDMVVVDSNSALHKFAPQSLVERCVAMMTEISHGNQGIPCNCPRIRIRLRM